MGLSLNYQIGRPVVPVPTCLGVEPRTRPRCRGSTGPLAAIRLQFLLLGISSVASNRVDASSGKKSIIESSPVVDDPYRGIDLSQVDAARMALVSL